MIWQRVLQCYYNIACRAIYNTLQVPSFHKEMDQAMKYGECWRGICIIMKAQHSCGRYAPKLFFPHSQRTSGIGIFMLQNPVTWHWLSRRCRVLSCVQGLLLRRHHYSGQRRPWFVFIGRVKMYFIGTARLFDQLCMNERRKEGDALVFVKSSWHFSRSWWLFQDKS